MCGLHSLDATESAEIMAQTYFTDLTDNFTNCSIVDLRCSPREHLSLSFGQSMRSTFH